MDETKKDIIQKELLMWFDFNQRLLPWRERPEPYRVWVSEIMLQQTRVDTVVPYFNRFLDKFPTIEDLAKADIEEVLKCWEGLGYYARARNLWKGAKKVVEEYGGVLPQNEGELLDIPGIGDYTAGAILSIAYNKSYPAVDGNVIRVLSRVFLIRDDVGSTKIKNNIKKKAMELIPKGKASHFNQSLMELGALICTPLSPRCLACPLYEVCQARREGQQERIPIKKRKCKVPEVHRAVALIQQDNKYLIRRRPHEGLLGGLWEFPGYEIGTKDKEEDMLIQKIQSEFFLKVGGIEKIMEASHTFTHMKWKMHVFWCMSEGNISMTEDVWWADRAKLLELPFPTAFKKLRQWAVDSLLDKRLL